MCGIVHFPHIETWQNGPTVYSSNSKTHTQCEVNRVSQVQRHQLIGYSNPSPINQYSGFLLPTVLEML